ncbi:hypothetical protein [Dethiosulfatarculus sandiegensis]|uniref:Uncharacterized protein n=1 Tax=Dethiosulfatarculus sandiegensis TaxID=1429043 RepID=A0A0D2JJ14_9BACT|nr:hypothetical protein [Dethiosulfatarculus sandiegensis]KIX15671.1 hypothetical protein X474_01905 [Dethiosulfatarculus sandiegensis]
MQATQEASQNAAELKKHQTNAIKLQFETGSDQNMVDLPQLLLGVSNKNSNSKFIS